MSLRQTDAAPRQPSDRPSRGLTRLVAVLLARGRPAPGPAPTGTRWWGEGQSVPNRLNGSVQRSRDTGPAYGRGERKGACPSPGKAAPGGLGREHVAAGGRGPQRQVLRVVVVGHRPRNSLPRRCSLSASPGSPAHRSEKTPSCSSASLQCTGSAGGSLCRTRSSEGLETNLVIAPWQCMGNLAGGALVLILPGGRPLVGSSPWGCPVSLLARRVVPDGVPLGIRWHHQGSRSGYRPGVGKPRNEPCQSGLMPVPIRCAGSPNPPTPLPGFPPPRGRGVSYLR